MIPTISATHISHSKARQVDRALQHSVTVDEASAAVPLVVELDDALLQASLDREMRIAAMLRKPLELLGRGRNTFRQNDETSKILEPRSIRPSALPYDADAIGRIRAAQSLGKRVYLVSSTNTPWLVQIAESLGVPAACTIDATRIETGEARLARILAATNGDAFDYIGGSDAYIPVWRGARQKMLVARNSRSVRSLQKEGIGVEILSRRPSRTRAAIKMLRAHQWAKNLLLLVPLVAAHRVADLGALVAAAKAFAAFSFCASGVYVLNDLVDIDADREHPRKKHRPFAAGLVPMDIGIAVGIVLLLSAATIAIAVTPLFAALLALYGVVTTAYSLVLKRFLLIDAVTLACLYALRVLAGGAAIDVRPSAWLLTFSLFLFLCLALVKRYGELNLRRDLAAQEATNRDYRVSDLPVVGALAAAAGFNAVTVFTLYVSSDTVRRLYQTPAILWFACPVLIYWIGRIIMLAHRGLLHDDPVVFALRDPVSLACGCAMLAIVWGATL